MTPMQRKIIDESVKGRTFTIFKMQVKAVAHVDTQFCGINSLSMHCGPCFVVHHRFPTNAVAETLTATPKTVRRSIDFNS